MDYSGGGLLLMLLFSWLLLSQFLVLEGEMVAVVVYRAHVSTTPGVYLVGTHAQQIKQKSVHWFISLSVH